jgi:predicted MFS family arabinose efflux permease
MGLCLAGIAAMLPWPIEFANFMLLGFAFYSLHAVIQIYASELAPSARGSAMALHTVFFFLGQAVGPAFYGAGLSSSIGIKPLLLTGAVVLVAVGFICAQWLRRDPAAV